jgi:hypothetical protein
MAAKKGSNGLLIGLALGLGGLVVLGGGGAVVYALTRDKGPGTMQLQQQTGPSDQTLQMQAQAQIASSQAAAAKAQADAVKAQAEAAKKEPWEIVVGGLFDSVGDFLGGQSLF